MINALHCSRRCISFTGGIFVGCFLTTIFLTFVILPQHETSQSLRTSYTFQTANGHAHVESFQMNDSLALAYNCLEKYAPQLMIVPTRTQPSFPITVLDESRQHAASIDLLHYGIGDVHLLELFSPLLFKHCSSSGDQIHKKSSLMTAGIFPGHSSSSSALSASSVSGLSPGPATIIEVGANIAFFSLYAATLGCRVRISEPVITFRRALDASLCANHELGKRVTLLSGGVDDDNSTTWIYNGIDGEREDVDPLREKQMDCVTRPDSNDRCKKVDSVSWLRLLGSGSLSKNILLLKLNGDFQIIHSLLRSGRTYLPAIRIPFIVLPFYPRRLGFALSLKVLSLFDELHYTVAEIPWKNPEEHAGWLSRVREWLTNNAGNMGIISALATTREIHMVDEDAVKAYINELIECRGIPIAAGAAVAARGSVRGGIGRRYRCRVDLLFSYQGK